MKRVLIVTGSLIVVFLAYWFLGGRHLTLATLVDHAKTKESRQFAFNLVNRYGGTYWVRSWDREGKVLHSDHLKTLYRVRIGFRFGIECESVSDDPKEFAVLFYE